MRAHAPTLALFSLLSVAVVAAQSATQAAPRQDAAAIAPISGSAEIVDGDTLKIGVTTIRLHGIDAPETSQLCAAPAAGGFFRRPDPGTWKCGLDARRALARLTAGDAVDCMPTMLDKYGRTVARCSVRGADVGAELVRQGLAWAFVRYSNDYAAIEKDARDAKRGIWQMQTQTAWGYRAGKWQAAEVADTTAPDGCNIKGNVSWTGERIYHLPWSPWYDSIKMDTAALTRKGKRWFCNEAEAQAAGWRASATR